MESRLEQAIRHVRRGREIVAAQRLRVRAVKARGGDPSESEILLRQFESALAIFEGDLIGTSATHHACWESKIFVPTDGIQTVSPLAAPACGVREEDHVITQNPSGT